MPDPNFTILYVDSPSQSAAFYATLFGKDPVEISPTFALFALGTGAMFGLWSKHTVAPTATPVGGSEVAFGVCDDATVDTTYADWTGRGIPILQERTQMDFGYTFVATDPDGHRLRVFSAH